ncbi:MAG: polyisoprenyl-phosphate glycosyltransferase, partial [Actinoplanes sp.]|nr:polyisoprenyl-phosphate glycosyltransferase [Actinoplanes sp.]
TKGRVHMNVLSADGGELSSVPRLSVVVPVFNEEDVLPLFAQRVRPVLDDLGVSSDEALC